MDVMATISALSSGLDILKTLKDIDLEFDRAKYKAQVAELMSTLAEAKISLLDAKEQIQSRDIELTRTYLKITDRCRSDINAE